MKRTINVLYVRAGESPRAVTIPNNLKFMQKLVGGSIERYALPTDDDAVIICNDEGKISGLPLNRGIFIDNSELIDIIAGDFFICNARNDRKGFSSLTLEQIQKYAEEYKFPERFCRVNREIVVVPLMPKIKYYER